MLVFIVFSKPLNCSISYIQLSIVELFDPFIHFLVVFKKQPIVVFISHCLRKGCLIIGFIAKVWQEYKDISKKKIKGADIPQSYSLMISVRIFGKGFEEVKHPSIYNHKNLKDHEMALRWLYPPPMDKKKECVLLCNRGC